MLFAIEREYQRAQSFLQRKYRIFCAVPFVTEEASQRTGTQDINITCCWCRVAGPTSQIWCKNAFPLSAYILCWQSTNGGVSMFDKTNPRIGYSCLLLLALRTWVLTRLRYYDRSSPFFTLPVVLSVLVGSITSFR